MLFKLNEKELAGLFRLAPPPCCVGNKIVIKRLFIIIICAHRKGFIKVAPAEKAKRVQIYLPEIMTGAVQDINRAAPADPACQLN